jgi:hypothetical protein
MDFFGFLPFEKIIGLWAFNEVTSTQFGLL